MVEKKKKKKKKSFIVPVISVSFLRPWRSLWSPSFFFPFMWFPPQLLCWERKGLPIWAGRWEAAGQLLLFCIFIIVLFLLSLFFFINIFFLPLLLFLSLLVFFSSLVVSSWDLLNSALKSEMKVLFLYFIFFSFEEKRKEESKSSFRWEIHIKRSPPSKIPPVFFLFFSKHYLKFKNKKGGKTERKKENNIM